LWPLRCLFFRVLSYSCWRLPGDAFRREKSRQMNGFFGNSLIEL